jgi:hypothetical protein
MSLLLCGVVVSLLIIPITIAALDPISFRLRSTSSDTLVVPLPSTIRIVFSFGIPSIVLLALVGALKSAPVTQPFTAAPTSVWLQPFAQQRLLWMSDFSQPDPLHILPVIAGIMTTGLGFVMLRRTRGTFRRAICLYLLLLGMLSVAISTFLASGVALVWVLGCTVILTLQYGFALNGPYR